MSKLFLRLFKKATYLLQLNEWILEKRDICNLLLPPSFFKMNASFKISDKTPSTTFYSVKCSRHSMTDFNLNPITKSRRWPLREFPSLRLLTHTTYEIIFASLFRKWFFSSPCVLGERAHHIRRLNQERPEREKHSCGFNYIRWSALLFLRFGLAGKWWYPFRHLRICIYALLKGGNDLQVYDNVFTKGISIFTTDPPQKSWSGYYKDAIMHEKLSDFALQNFFYRLSCV